MKNFFGARIWGIALLVVLGAMLISLVVETLQPVSPLSPPLPTRADGQIENSRSVDGRVTPLPDELVRVGDMVEISDSPIAEERYEIRNDYREYTPADAPPYSTLTLTVVDRQTGEEFRIGNDSGKAKFGVMNEEHIIWSFLCEECVDLKYGLYAYSFSTGQSQYITDTFSSSIYPKTSGSWVVYPLVDEHYAKHAASGSLYAYNLDTGETIHVTPNVALYRAGTSDYFAIDGNIIAWFAMTDFQIEGLYVFDLVSRSTRLLSLPEPIGGPLNLTVSNGYLIWWDNFWQGYDLSCDAYFSIYMPPPGWENATYQVALPIRVENNQLFWLLEADKVPHYFVASLYPKSEPITIAP